MPLVGAPWHSPASPSWSCRAISGSRSMRRNAAQLPAEERPYGWPGDAPASHVVAMPQGHSQAPPSSSGTTVNTGTVPTSPRRLLPAGPPGMGASTAGRLGTGRSRRSTPRPGKPAAWGRAAAVSRRDGCCNAGRRPAEWRSPGPLGPGTGGADQASRPPQPRRLRSPAVPQTRPATACRPGRLHLRRLHHRHHRGPRDLPWQAQRPAHGTTSAPPPSRTCAPAACCASGAPKPRPDAL